MPFGRRKIKKMMNFSFSVNLFSLGIARLHTNLVGTASCSVCIQWLEIMQRLETEENSSFSVVQTMIWQIRYKAQHLFVITKLRTFGTLFGLIHMELC